MTIEKMTYRQLEEKLTANRAKLSKTTNLTEKRALILEDHLLMVEMDRRWNVAEAKRGMRK